jgi:hypothetical protein
VKQKRAKPGDPLADDSTEIGKGEDIVLPDIKSTLDDAQAALDKPKRRRMHDVCAVCGKPFCLWHERRTVYYEE